MYPPADVLLAAEYTLSHTPSDGVLVALGFAMILTFMALIMTGRATPMVALILVPTVFGLLAGAGFGIGDMVLDAIGDMASTAALLMFAIMFFGIMINVGLFDPLIRAITRTLGDDPAKVVLGTAVLAGVVSLDGDGSTTFIITTSAMLPIYLRLGMSPVVLTVVAGLINGTMNILPWGGPTVRAATALGLDPSAVFVPMIPSLVVGVVIVFVFSWFLGVAERRRLGGSLDTSRFGGEGATGAGSGGGGPRGGTARHGNSDDRTPTGGGVLLDDRAFHPADGEHPRAGVAGASNPAQRCAEQYGEGERLLRVAGGRHTQGALGVAEHRPLGQMVPQVAQVVQGGDLPQDDAGDGDGGQGVHGPRRGVGVGFDELREPLEGAGGCGGDFPRDRSGGGARSLEQAAQAFPRRAHGGRVGEG